MNLNSNFSRITDPNFFTICASELAQKLLGKILVRKINDQIIKFKVVETEAYDGIIDKACHAHPENRSRKKATSLFNRGGFTYVYLIYNIYHCFNITSSFEGIPQGVLIRAVEPLGLSNINFQSKSKKNIYHHTNGPGKLCRILKININLNNIDLTTSNLIYLENKQELKPKEIVATRINIDYAGKDKNLL